MTGFPGSPKLLKGAMVGIDNANPLPSVIIFQYNPTKLTRTFNIQASSDGAPSEALCLSGAPSETFQLDVEIDATDQLEIADANAVSMGIYPQLSALEMLLYPKSSRVIANTALMAAGTLEVIPPETVYTLFIWGIKRVVPVRLTQFTINEEAYDTSLNPIMAKVTLGMRVLSYNDLPVTHVGYHAFMAHQVTKEAMAAVGTVSSIAAAAGNAKII